MKLPATARILIIPDSFKGTLSSQEAATAMEAGFREVFPHAQLVTVPLADGGEGSSSLIGKVVGAERRDARTIGPEGDEVDSFYYYDTIQRRAYIELAASSGLTLVRDLGRSAIRATTYGTGQLIESALNAGAQEIFLFLGGSATTDGGVGFAKALGYQFLDSQGALLAPPRAGYPYPGEELQSIFSIKRSKLVERLSGIKVYGIADVKNSLFGEQGAAFIYGPQKGADPNTVYLLDQGLRNLARVCAADIGVDRSQVLGAGAAGGSGFGVLTFLGGSLLSGAAFFLDALKIAEQLPHVDLLVTGEGKLDRQSLEGKLLSELLQRTIKSGTPLISLCGEVDVPCQEVTHHRNISAFGIGRRDALTNSADALQALSVQVARLLT